MRYTVIRPFVDAHTEAHVPSGSKLYAFRDDHGQWIAFPTEHEAREMVDRNGSKVEEVPFGAFLDDHPKNLIHLFDQYYWAQDLD